MSTEQKAQAVRQLIQAGSAGREKIVAEKAKSLGVAPVSVWRWLAAFNRDGIDGLRPRERNDKGVSRFFRDNPLVGLFAACKYAAGIKQPGALLAAIREELGSPLPDRKTLKAFLRTHAPSSEDRE